MYFLGISLLFLLFCGGLCNLLFIVITVRGQSMFPTLENGDRVVAVRFWPLWLLSRRQIVVIKSDIPLPGEPPIFPNFYIKRIVGLPGDIIRISKNEVIEKFDTNARSFREKNGSTKVWIVPTNHIFICGDNLKHSKDSRKWGPISQKSVVGIVLKRMR